LLTDQLIGNAVIVAIDLHVLIDVGAYGLPLRQHLAFGREWLPRRLIQGGIERSP
jgi:hypothetical protein